MHWMNYIDHVVVIWSNSYDTVALHHQLINQISFKGYGVMNSLASNPACLALNMVWPCLFGWSAGQSGGGFG